MFTVAHLFYENGDIRLGTTKAWFICSEEGMDSQIM